MASPNPSMPPMVFLAKARSTASKSRLWAPLSILHLHLLFSACSGLTEGVKNFSEFTHKIGWVDPHSELYALGVRPGDEIVSYNGHMYESAKDHLYAPMTSSELEVKGFKVNSLNGEKVPFGYRVKPYPHPSSLEKGILTGGILQTASYIVYDMLPGGQENPLPEGAPLQNSGIRYGDRIIWMDGEPVYSIQQLNHILNDGRALLTIKRGNKVFLRRIPRVQVQDLKLDTEFKEELTDWQFEAQLNNVKIPKLYTIPYTLTNDCVVEREVRFIDKENQEEAFPKHPFSELEQELLPGDRILAVRWNPSLPFL